MRGAMAHRVRPSAEHPRIIIVKRRPRNLFKLAAFLLLGAIINVSVACGCSIRALYQPRDFDWAWLKDDAFDVAQSSLERLGWSPRPFTSDCYYSLAIAARFRNGVTSYHVLEEDHCSRPLASTPRIPARVLLFDSNSCMGVSAGFPLRSVWGASYLSHDGDPPTVMNSGLILCPRIGACVVASQGWSRTTLPGLPMRAVWPSFAINTILYAAILWVLWIAPGKIRRYIRVRGHRCPACGYKIDSAPGIGPRCSECGHPLPWQTADAAQQQKT
jgi:hypothetical protein